MTTEITGNRARASGLRRAIHKDFEAVCDSLGLQDGIVDESRSLYDAYARAAGQVGSKFAALCGCLLVTIKRHRLPITLEQVSSAIVDAGRRGSRKSLFWAIQRVNSALDVKVPAPVPRDFLPSSMKKFGECLAGWWKIDAKDEIPAILRAVGSATASILDGLEQGGTPPLSSLAAALYVANKAVLGRRRLTQATIAGLCGVHPSTIRNVLRRWDA